MKYVVTYVSRTGNTKLLAETIKNELDALCVEAELVEFSSELHVDSKAVLFIGYWCDKGSCSIELAQWIASLHNHQVAFFGTAGFGGEAAYFNRIATTVEALLPKDNELLGSRLCQGKMPRTVGDRYAAMLAANPNDPRMEQMLENFHKASSHPDSTDLDIIRNFVRDIVSQN